MSDKLVACVLPAGQGPELQRRLFRELGLSRVDLHSARGFMGSDPARLFNRLEYDVLSAIVPAERADEVFEWIYHEAKVAELEGRFLYVANVSRSTPFALPKEVPIEEA